MATKTDVESEIVSLNLYDISFGLAKKLSGPLLGKEMDGLWRSSIAVGGVEYAYVPPLKRATAQDGGLVQPDRVITLGPTMVPACGRNEIMEALHDRYSLEAYDPLFHNSNTFSNEFATLLTGVGIPEEILTQVQDILSSPFGESLLAAMSGEIPPEGSPLDTLPELLRDALRGIAEDEGLTWQRMGPGAGRRGCGRGGRGGPAFPHYHPGRGHPERDNPEAGGPRGPRGHPHHPHFRGGRCGFDPTSCGGRGRGGWGVQKPCWGTRWGARGRRGPCGPGGPIGMRGPWGPFGMWAAGGPCGGDEPTTCEQGEDCQMPTREKTAGGAVHNWDPAAAGPSNTDGLAQEAPAGPSPGEAAPRRQPMSEPDPKVYVHVGISCDVCGVSPIVGACYHSLSLPDFDACYKCKDHPVTRAAGPHQVIPEGVEEEGAQVPATIHWNVSCDICAAHPVVGLRYKSLSLPNFDHCEGCVEHPVAKAAGPYKVTGTSRSSQAAPTAGHPTEAPAVTPNPSPPNMPPAHSPLVAVQQPTGEVVVAVPQPMEAEHNQQVDLISLHDDDTVEPAAAKDGDAHIEDGEGKDVLDITMSAAEDAPGAEQSEAAVVTQQEVAAIDGVQDQDERKESAMALALRPGSEGDDVSAPETGSDGWVEVKGYKEGQ